MQKGVIIIGMRRSGTSLTANVVRSMGISFHNDARPPDRSNVKGYFESRESEFLNGRILLYLGGDQDRPPPTPEGWENRKKLLKLSKECRSFISELQTEERWGWKDTRLCITLPFWKHFLAKEISYLICVRNPLEVARSWNSMDRREDIGTAVALWYTFTANALKNTLNERVLLVFHEDFFSRSEEQVSSIANFIGSRYDPALQALAAGNLRHQEASTQDLLSNQLVPDEAKELYSSLLMAKSDQGELRKLQEKFADYSKSFSPWNHRLRSRLRYYSSFGGGWKPIRILKNMIS